MQPHGRVDLPLSVRRVIKASFRLSAGLKWVWCEDYWLDQGPEGAWISAARLGRRLGMSTSAVEQYRRVLVRCGLHEAVKRDGERGAGWYAVVPSHVVPREHPSDEEVERLAADLDRWLQIRTRGEATTANTMRRRDTHQRELLDRSPTQIRGSTDCNTHINPPRPPHKSDSDPHINPSRPPHKSDPDTHINPTGSKSRERVVKSQDGESGTNGNFSPDSPSGYEVTLPTHGERAGSVAHATTESGGSDATPSGDHHLDPGDFERYWTERLRGSDA